MSFPRYPKYKDSGVEWLGEVPGHWEVMALRRCLLEHRQGYYSQSAYVDSGVKLLRITDLRDFGRVDFAQCPQVEDLPELEAFLLRPSDFVFARTGGAGTFGMVEELTEPAAYASYLIRFRFTEQANSPFLRNFFLSSGFQEAVRQNIHGGVNKNIHAEDIKDQFLALPPLPEQTAIATFLDRETAKIDGLVAEQRRLMELLKEKRQAVISHAVTKGLNPDAPMKPSGIEWLGDVPEHWEFGPLKRFWPVVDCKHVTVPFLEEGYPVASVMEVRTFELDLSRVLRTNKESYELLIGGDRQPKKGDVIYCRNTANTGTSAYVGTDEPICIGQDVVLMKSGQQNGRFLNYILHGPEMAGQLAQYMVGSTFKRINVADIRELIVTCPPRAEQDEIVKFLDLKAGGYDTLTAEAQRAIELLQERRTALISAAVTGQIDVRKEVA